MLAAAATTAVEWIRHVGPAGPAVFAALYIAAAVLLVPGSMLTLAAGFLYGPVWGTALVSPVSVVAALLAFALARTALRPWAVRRLAGRPRLAAVERAVSERGGRIVLLLRLSPVVPYSTLNYACGLTRIGAARYALASWLGMLPGTVLYAYLGSLAANAAALGGGVPASPVARAMYWAGLAATIGAAIIISRVARGALREALGAPTTESA